MATFAGMTVYVSPALPIPPSHREVARRIVRHGMADILEWLGEEVGPRPDDEVHVIIGVDPANPLLPASGVAFVSQSLFEQLERQQANGWGAA